MKARKLARLLGLAAGVGAIAWAMRERFVTLTLTREPEPPTFTLPPEPVESPVSVEPDDLTQIPGIGPVFARRLMEAGIATFSHLAAADPSAVAGITNVPIARVDRWIQESAGLT